MAIAGPNASGCVFHRVFLGAWKGEEVQLFRKVDASGWCAKKPGKSQMKLKVVLI